MNKINIVLGILFPSVLLCQTVDATFLNPKNITAGSYKYMRFGDATDYYAGFLWNEGNSYYGDGNDFSIFTYGERDMTFRTGLGNFIIFPNESGGNVGIKTSSPRSQLVIGHNFGANISGTSEGNALFGSNLAYIQGGSDHDQLITPSGHSNNYGYSGMRSSWGKLYFYTGSGNTVAGQVISPLPRIFVDNNGEVGIGTAAPDAKLTVKGKIHAEEVRIDLSVPGPDYVFAANYELPDLKEIQDYIQQHGHLPNMPSAAEMEENGVELGLMNMKLLEKIEELTLYIIGQEKRIADLYDQQDTNEKLQQKMDALEALMLEVVKKRK